MELGTPRAVDSLDFLVLGVSLVFLVLGCSLVALVLGPTVPKSVTHRGLLVDLHESSFKRKQPP